VEKGYALLKRNADGYGEKETEATKAKKRYSDVDNGMDGDVRETWQNLEEGG